MKIIPDSENNVLSDLMMQVECIQYRLEKIRKTDVSKADIAAMIIGSESCVDERSVSNLLSQIMYKSNRGLAIQICEDFRYKYC